VSGQCFSPGTSTNKTDCHDITEILLKVALNTITPNSIANHSNFIDFTSHTHFYIMASLPAFVKAGENPAILEKQAVNMFILVFL
jgi:hypothetical protein